MEDLGEISYENPEEQYATFEAAWKKSAEGKFGLMRAIWMSTGLAMFYPILPGKSGVVDVISAEDCA